MSSLPGLTSYFHYGISINIANPQSLLSAKSILPSINYKVAEPDEHKQGLAHEQASTGAFINSSLYIVHTAII